MSNRDPVFWMRELARTGLPPADQKEFSASLSNAAETRARYFPAEPLPNLDRVRQFLMAAFFPQKGPSLLSVDRSSPPERLSRSQCWQIAHLELSLLDGPSRPVDELHTVIADIITSLVRSELPLSIPSRWLMVLLGRWSVLRSLKSTSMVGR